MKAAMLITILKSRVLKKAAFALLLLFGLLQPAYGADHTVPYSMEEYFWTYGCTPTASSMVMGYWDNNYFYGRLIDYYYDNSCGNSGHTVRSVPNVIDELKSCLGTNWNTGTCTGDGGTSRGNIQGGLQCTTNTANSYGFSFGQCWDCGDDWNPQCWLGDWCLGDLKGEINAGRPVVWSHWPVTGTGHTVPVWGYRDDNYLIIYDTWAPAGRVDWYYLYYLGNSSDPVGLVQADKLYPGGFDSSKVSLDTPNGGNTLLTNHPYTVWWYQWGTSTTTVDLRYSTNGGVNWTDIAGYVPSVEGWNSYTWWVPNISSSTSARFRVSAYNASDAYISGDGSRENFTISAPTCASLSFPTDRWQRVWKSYNGSYCLGNGPDEANIQFDNNWGDGTVAHSRTDDIQFTSSRSINIPAAGTYRFTVGSDDGVRLYIDGVLRIDQWIVRGYAANTADVALTAGYHSFRLDYFEDGGGARVSFSYAALPDLVVQSISTNPTYPRPGQTVSVTMTVRNQGAGAAGAFFIDFYKNRATAPTVGVYGDGWCNPAGLAAGATTTCTLSVSYASAGAYSMWAQADSEGSVAEANNANNVFGPQSIVVDGTPPETTINTHPNAFIRSTTATFTFSSNEAGSTFQCAHGLTGGMGIVTPCTSPVTYNGLAEGGHWFSVAAIDRAGNVDSTAAGFSWTVDLTAPNTTINTMPNVLINSTAATFSFSSNEAGSTFQCSRDGAAFSACTSPTTYTGLMAGNHAFSVYAIDQAGNWDATPANYGWSIDLAPPDTTLDTMPALLTNSASATFTFSSNDATATFRCLIDTGIYTACTSPRTYTGLLAGNHVFSVMAVDQAGNTDQTPIVFGWSIDLTPPDTAINTRPALLTNSVDAGFSFSSPDSTASFQCVLDSGGWAACESPRTYLGLLAGNHVFYVRAVDQAGNPDPTPAVWGWSIDLTPPATTLNTHPAVLSNSADAGFAFSSSESGTFECAIDNGGWAACENPRTYLGLSEGNHVFSVRAVDQAGNVDPTPVNWGWSIDVTLPETTPSAPGGTFTTPQDITLNCNDGTGSGCFRTYYCLGTGCSPTAVFSVTSPISITESADLIYYSVDNAGNSEAIQTATYIIDYTATPSSLEFLSPLNVQSAAQTVTLNNTTGAAVAITGIALGGANPGQFSQTNDCGGSLAVGDSCTINVTFRPTWANPVPMTALLNINAAAPAISKSLPLTGNLDYTVTPASAAFRTPLNVPSAVRNVTVTNTTGIPLTINSISLGGTNPGQFSQTNNCSSLAVGASCIIGVTFRPTWANPVPMTATLNINVAEPAKFKTIGLTGTLDYLLTPAALPAFSTPLNVPSAVKNVTVTNTTGAPLTISSIALGGTNPGQFSQTNNCGSSLAVGASCVIGVTFRPTWANPVPSAATLNVNVAAPALSKTIALTGALDYLLTPAALPAFVTPLNVPSAVKNVTVTNTTGVPLAISSISLGGTNPGQFSQTNTCGSSLAVGASCVVSVTFRPTWANPAPSAATLNVNVAAPAASKVIALIGTLDYTLSPSTLAVFHSPLNVPSAAKNVTVSNTTGNALAISSISIGGTNPGQFSQTNNCGTSLAVGSSCVISVTFRPTWVNTVPMSATLNLNVATPATSKSIVLSGTTP